MELLVAIVTTVFAKPAITAAKSAVTAAKPVATTEKSAVTAAISEPNDVQLPFNGLMESIWSAQLIAVAPKQLSHDVPWSAGYLLPAATATVVAIAK